ncbi:hypothetical protein NJ7G_3500 [Natrinema sp. J7-2]|nr:hypothetical protein NJ7G_3500 [Natrinema sp. J7-2]
MPEFVPGRNSVDADGPTASGDGRPVMPLNWPKHVRTGN